MTDKKESTSGAYWKQHVISWEASAYFKDSRKQPTFWDRMWTDTRISLSILRVILLNKLSIILSQDACFGVKTN